MTGETPVRFPPAVPPGFALSGAEPVSDSLRRITVEQFDLALGELVGGVDLDRAVHETRKATKRLRAILRMVRGEIGERAYRVENAVLRDTARRISPMRDDHVLGLSVAGLGERYGRLLAADAFDDVRERLGRRAAVRKVRLLADPRLLPEVVTTLRAARARYASWPTEGDPAVDLYGRRPLGDGFDVIAPGIARTYRRGRVEMETAIARPTPEALHTWRKRAKYLRHQMEVLEPVWPEMIGATARSLDRLGEMLGDDHDLHELATVLIREPEWCPDPAVRSLLLALIRQRRQELQSGAVVLGRRLYAERPRQFVGRLGTYFTQWRLEPR